MYKIEKFYDFTETEIPFKNKVLDFYIDNYDKKIACLDIETTGLSPKKSKFILGALLEFCDNGYLLKQYFAESPNEEKELLEIYIGEIKKYDILLTYNGKHFDLKYLQEKIHEHKLYAHFNFPLNLDLYLFVDKFSPLRKFLPNLKQKTVEGFMGIWDKRTDMISGAESIGRYYDYLVSKDNEIRGEIMLHNSDDVLQLARLFPVMLKCELDKAFYKLDCPLGFIIKEEIEIKNKVLTVRGITRERIAPYICYNIDELACKFSIDGKSNKFTLSIPLIKKENMDILSLKNIHADFNELDLYENYASNYLLLKRGKEIYYKSIIHALKIIFNRIEELMLN